MHSRLMQLHSPWLVLIPFALLTTLQYLVSLFRLNQNYIAQSKAILTKFYLTRVFFQSLC